MRRPSRRIARRFVLERVPPVNVQIVRQSPGMRDIHENKAQFVPVEPGKTAKVQLGGEGRHVIGKLATPTEQVHGLNGPLAWQDVRAKVYTYADLRFEPGDREPRPEGLDRMTPQQRDAALRALAQSPEYREYRRRAVRHEYEVAADGTFRVEDVRPGKYHLYVRTMQSDPQNAVIEEIANAVIPLEVPPLPAGVTWLDRPLDVGTLTMRIKPRLIVGQPAPDFEIETFDGKSLKLADFKGKYLLVFLARAFMDAEEWAGLKKAYDSYAKDSDFAMVTVHRDPRGQTNQQLQEMVDKHGVKWPQATVPTGQGRGNGWAIIERAYQGTSGAVLIDPEGKVADRNISPQRAEQAVAKVLLEHR